MRIQNSCFVIIVCWERRWTQCALSSSFACSCVPFLGEETPLCALITLLFGLGIVLERPRFITGNHRVRKSGSDSTSSNSSRQINKRKSYGFGVKTFSNKFAQIFIICKSSDWISCTTVFGKFNSNSINRKLTRRSESKRCFTFTKFSSLRSLLPHFHQYGPLKDILGVSCLPRLIFLYETSLTLKYPHFWHAFLPHRLNLSG